VPRIARVARSALLGALAALVAAGCAAPVKILASADPLGVLGGGSMAYARLGGASARELAPSILEAKQAAALAPLLSRTRLVALGLGSLPAPPGAEAPSFQACLVGDYPFRAASLSLGANPAWKREKAGYYNAALGLRAALPGPSLALASSGPLEPLLAAAKAPGASPIPASLEATAQEELVLWLPLPFAGLIASILGEAMDIPARGLLISASPLAASPGTAGRIYEARVIFLMEDADSARIFRPALKLAWYGLASGLLGEEAEAALGAKFELAGDSYAASGIRLSGAALATALSRLGGSLGIPQPR
jgi:hypothetical protein